MVGLARVTAIREFSLPRESRKLADSRCLRNNYSGCRGTTALQTHGITFTVGPVGLSHRGSRTRCVHCFLVTLCLNLRMP